MPQIRHFDLNPPLPEEINTILESHAEGTPEIKQTKNLDLNAARKALNTHGAAIEDVAETIASIMQRGETDSGRLKAGELALKVHGILQEMDSKPVPNITINVIGSENKTLINLVLPTV